MSLAKAFDQWALQICHDRFQDFCQTRDTKNLKLSLEWDFAPGRLSYSASSSSKFCIVSSLGSRGFRVVNVRVGSTGFQVSLLVFFCVLGPVNH